MAKYIDCAGITTLTFTAGVSTITGVTAGPSVNDMYVVGTTGGLLWLSGQSIGVSAMVNGGAAALLNIQAKPISLGIADLYFTASGSAVVVSIMKRLSAGYSNS